jgi:glycerophosphoryl diester phosphodiesterase
MKYVKRILIVISVLGVILTFLMFGPKRQFERINPFLAKDGMPLVMAHAGGKGKFPDNTMKAYLYAFDFGVDVLEMDLQMTSDGVLVLSHGQNVTGNLIEHSQCDGVIWKFTYEYLYNTCNMAYTYQEKDSSYLYKDLDFDGWVEEKVYLPTLAEVFETFGKDTLYNIEIKADSDAPRLEVADKLYELIKLYDLFDYVLVATAFDDISAHIIENYKELFISTSSGAARTWILGSLTYTSFFLGIPSYSAIQVPTSYGFPVIETLRLDQRSLIRTIQSHNMAMHYWTINDESTMRDLIKKGADGIITDDIELLTSIMNEMRQA